MFSIEAKSIDPNLCAKELCNSAAGARVVFEGLVRNHNAGKNVSSLEYEVFEELAKTEGDKILQESIARFGLIEAKAYHRQGHLELEELAVWIGVIAAHREEAFKACRFIIDELKSRLPIWKKEHYADGTSLWVNCHGCHKNQLSILKEQEYYQRQTRLPDFANESQRILKDAHVSVIGAGGLGVPALTYLAASGVGSIEIFDNDRLEASNLHRQTLYAYDEIGEYKALLAKKKLEQLNPFIRITANTERVDTDNIENLVKKSDVVLDCCDNFTTKFLLNDACFLGRTTLVTASIYRHEGQLHCLLADGKSGCLRCLWPSIPEKGSTGTCADAGVLGATVGVFGSMQAMEAIKNILDPQKGGLEQTVVYDLMNQEMIKIRRPKNKDCPLCGESPTIRSISIHNYNQPKQYSLAATAIDLTMDRLIDIREENEWDSVLLFEGKVERSALSNFDPTIIRPNCRTILFCTSGARSQRLTNELRTQGFANVYSLKDGISRWEERPSDGIE